MDGTPPDKSISFYIVIRINRDDVPSPGHRDYFSFFTPTPANVCESTPKPLSFFDETHARKLSPHKAKFAAPHASNPHRAAYGSMGERIAI
jgi:hypothetical protein